MKSIINKIVLFFVLLDNIFLPIDIGVDFRLNYLVMIIYIVYYACTHKSIELNKKKSLVLLVGVVLFLAITILTAESFFLVIKQLILISITFTFSYLLLNSYRFDYIKLFKDYIILITLAGIIVVIQFFGTISNLTFLVDYSYLGLDTGGIRLNAPRGRFHSWFYEPSFMAYAFMPVIFIAVARLFGVGNLLSIRRSIFLIVILFMAKSTLGLLGLLLSVFILILSKYPIYKKPIFLLCLIVGLIGSSYLIYKIPAVKFRIDETYTLFKARKVTSEEIAKTNLSTYALYSNFKITQASLREAPLFGTGVGTYELNYDKHLNNVIPTSNWRNNFKINRQDANSLLFRILVETGLIGTVLLILFILKNKIPYRQVNSTIQQNLWMINNGILVLLTLRFLRQGHYTMLGFILMILVYYMTNQKTKRIAQI
ncbi:O-antigen ligase family protein [Cellulophaga sp. HaHa_2_95]|uniref:O-antigen ligase family protein n=1 Tax=unclassified Cellulophaga TaxID=2634405 RepID=UPI001C4F7D6A|nr:O-antigen ligase family protein [Cellulophaga sp. HaHa_2_95]QXP56495.1 O-antigen ligase family protein [Cellulophaga sp. HaHa_2_95]